MNSQIENSNSCDCPCDCQQSKVLIADEPTQETDPDNSWEIMNLLERINLKSTTVLMATHNSQIVNTLRHRVIAIENGRDGLNDELKERLDTMMWIYRHYLNRIKRV